MQTKICSCKTCGRAGKEQPLPAFNKNKSKKDGLSVWCKECCKKYKKTHIIDPKRAKEHRKTYYDKNKEKRKATTLEWRRKNPEKCKVYQKKYAENNPDKVKANQKNWRKNNLEKERIDGRNKAIKGRERLADWYVRSMIVKHSPELRGVIIPKELLDIQKENMKLKRTIKQKEKENV